MKLTCALLLIAAASACTNPGWKSDMDFQRSTWRAYGVNGRYAPQSWWHPTYRYFNPYKICAAANGKSVAQGQHNCLVFMNKGLDIYKYDDLKLRFRMAGVNVENFGNNYFEKWVRDYVKVYLRKQNSASCPNSGYSHHSTHYAVHGGGAKNVEIALTSQINVNGYKYLCVALQVRAHDDLRSWSRWAGEHGISWNRSGTHGMWGWIRNQYDSLTLSQFGYNPICPPCPKATCKTTTCKYTSGQTHVFQKFLDDAGTPIRAPEHWHCEKTPACNGGCSCKCAASLNCNLRHHHTSGYKKDFEHCTPTPAPTAYPTPQPTAYPTSQPTQHCQVGSWGPWTDCETTGSGGVQRVWSGGCRHHATGGGWHYYCLNGVDQNTASGYGYTHGDSNFRIQRAGFWRVNFFADHHGAGTHYHVRIQVNGRDIYYNHDYKWHDSGWSQMHGDVTWRMRSGWRFQISMHGRHYIWHAWHHYSGHPWHSRAQFIYLGANLKMWSGGCRHHCRHCTGWHTYCLNGQDTWDATHNPSGYITHDHWRLYARRTGFFRINFFAIQHGWPGYFQSRILVSGRTIYYNHNYRWWTDAGWSTVDMDVNWRINNGQNVQVQMYSPNNRGNVYTWHAWNHYGQHSRVQMTWKGTNVIMWSGGCRHHGHSRHRWMDYCLNGVDYNSCGGNCWTGGNQYMYLRKQGFWRVNFYTISHGHLQHLRVRFQHNHRDVFYSYRYKWHNSGWSQIMGDMTWWFNHNDHCRVSMWAGGHGGYYWHSWNYHGQHSRVQFTYQGGTQGHHYRQRFVTKAAANGGNACPVLYQRKACEA